MSIEIKEEKTEHSDTESHDYNYYECSFVISEEKKSENYLFEVSANSMRESSKCDSELLKESAYYLRIFNDNLIGSPKARTNINIKLLARINKALEEANGKEISPAPSKRKITIREYCFNDLKTLKVFLQSLAIQKDNYSFFPSGAIILNEKMVEKSFNSTINFHPKRNYSQSPTILFTTLSKQNHQAQNNTARDNTAKIELTS